MKPAKELGRLDAARGLLRASSRPSRGGEVHVCARSTPCAPRGPLGKNRPPRACPFGHSRSIHLGGDTGSAKEVLAACPCHPTDGWRPEGLRVSRWSGPNASKQAAGSGRKPTRKTPLATNRATPRAEGILPTNSFSGTFPAPRQTSPPARRGPPSQPRLWGIISSAKRRSWDDWAQPAGCSGSSRPSRGGRYTLVQEAQRVRPGVHWGTTGRRAPAPLDTPGAFTNDFGPPQPTLFVSL